MPVFFFSNKRDKHSIILSRFVWPWAWGSRGELKVEKKSWKRKQLSELLIFSSIHFLLLLPKEKEFSVCHKSSQLTCVLPRGLIVAQMSCRFCFILAQKVAKLESSTLFFQMIPDTLEHYFKPICHQKVPFHFLHILWISPKMSHLKFWILAFSTNFCPINIELSGNTIGFSF